ncbi:hypothetical protein B0H11DRAFT_1973816 [Mycena galericulata]|nr:hypothetical protein B0H11DRAFT_2126745 [Mycena galericulata]KAJ7506388.1 hypothetical protein B0H11DRAFT_1973816 [Mycena galericulata]
MANNPGTSGHSSRFLGPGRLTGEAPIIEGDGSLVLAKEARAILEKWDEERRKRNDERAQRRAADERDVVSEDEEDELGPYILAEKIPSGEKPGPEGAETIPPKSPSGVVSGGPGNLLFEDGVAEKNTFRAHDNSIPVAIYSLAKNGISPPLTLFLPASLETIRSSNVKTLKHGTGESTKVTVIDVSEFPDERSLDQATFLTCYNTFLTFLETAAGTKILQGFARHYDNILADPELKLWFPAYRDFDRKIRAQFFTSPYIVDPSDMEYRSALQSAKNLYLMSNSGGSFQSKGSGSHHSKEKQERTKPYDREDPSRQRTIICFRCGRVGHSAPLCKETNPNRHGREFVIFANRDGLFRIHDNRPVCMGFNCARCLASGNNHPVHICSLCGDTHHGAVNCTRN